LPAGQAGRDVAGRFLVHPAGKIRFRYRWAPSAWLAAMYRGGIPAGGVVAAELAAWPPLEAVPEVWPGNRGEPGHDAGG
jgi:hypothetical protein